jgi:hypothetical protein
MKTGDGEQKKAAFDAEKKGMQRVRDAVWPSPNLEEGLRQFDAEGLRRVKPLSDSD